MAEARGTPDTHFTLPEVAGLPGMPCNGRHVCDRARQEGWNAHGVKRPFGKGLMYPIELLPPATLKALTEKRQRKADSDREKTLVFIAYLKVVLADLERELRGRP